MITCTFEDGNSTSLRHGVADVILVQDEKILLVKRSNKLTLEPGKWTIPGGFVDRDETIVEAAHREVLEETGYALSGLTLLHINSNPNRPGEDRQNISFVFFATTLEKQGEPDWEVSETKWFGFDQLPSKETVAFDHYNNLLLYLKRREEKFTLPVLQ